MLSASRTARRVIPVASACLLLAGARCSGQAERPVGGGGGGAAGASARAGAGGAGGSANAVRGGSGGAAGAAGTAGAAAGRGGTSVTGPAGASGGGGASGSGGASTTAGSGGTTKADAGAAGASGEFSAELDVYPRLPSAATKSVDDIYTATLAKGESPDDATARKRKEIIAMYKDFGIDLSIDATSFYSDQLAAARPKHWSAATPAPLEGDFAAPFSVDAPVYHRAPKTSGRVELPTGTLGSAQLNCVHGFDGLGYAVVNSRASTRMMRFTDGVRTMMGRVPEGDLGPLLPAGGGDHQTSFIDATAKTFVDCIGTTLMGSDEVRCGFVVQQSLPNLGDAGGTIASGMSTLAGLIRPGEITSDTRPLAHALYFGTRKMWKARVYPAVSGDAWIYGDNTDATRVAGLIPYGGLMVLDPDLDLKSVAGLSLPARRILEAMQTYGAYQMNATDADFNIYTAVDEGELTAFAPVYTSRGDGIQEQVARVLSTQRLFLVPPPVKR